jgi:hypothetical protein
MSAEGPRSTPARAWWVMVGGERRRGHGWLEGVPFVLTTYSPVHHYLTSRTISLCSPALVRETHLKGHPTNYHNISTTLATQLKTTHCNFRGFLQKLMPIRRSFLHLSHRTTAQTPRARRECPLGYLLS